MGDLIERLRHRSLARLVGKPTKRDKADADLDAKAADALEAKDAEIARLREALRQIWDVSADRSAHPDDRAREWVEVRARAALAEDDTPGEKEA
jgi:hypothetical protein